MYNPRPHAPSPIAAGRPSHQQQQQIDTTPLFREAYRTPRSSRCDSLTIPQTTTTTTTKTKTTVVDGDNTTSSHITPRRSYQESPRRRSGGANMSPRRGYASPARCKNCYRVLQPGGAAEHDAHCPLKPLLCKHVDPRTGVMCGYICRGREMLAQHEAQCSAQRRSRSIGSTGRQTPSKRLIMDESQRQTPLPTDTFMCHKCSMTFSRSIDLANHRYVCAEEEVLCPLNCGKKFRRRDIVNHVKKQALEHEPMNIPSSKEYAEDDLRVVLAVVMNLLLEKRGSDTKSGGLLPQSVNSETPVRNSIQRSYPHITKVGSYTPIASRRSSVQSILAVSNQNSPPSSVYARRCRSTDSPASLLLESGVSMPQRQRVISRLIVPTENGTPLSNRSIRRGNDIKGEAKPGRGSASVQSEYSEFIIPSTVVSTTESPVLKRNEESAEASINQEEFDGLLDSMDLQWSTVDKLNQEYHANELKNMSEKELKKLSDDMQNVVDKVDAKNKDIHVQVMRFIDHAGVAPAHVMKVLGKWRTLDRHWYEVKFSLYDHMITNQV
ncbi:hypothetical protein LSM04_005856 [Trypanosoma melophagium]|uniref:uncharacterized protein n=1 Tax=Trypanosoma melophagium TaxID=715481 RepID=UPI00351A1B10|nr:hypothetical protein LSM04_005856 [Trypanosoma melophagium]